MDEELLGQFIIEGRELVEQATNDLVALERNPTDAARVDSVFRAVHTLKGSVGLFDFAPMGVALHAAEDLLGALRAKRAVANRRMIDALLECVSVNERWIEAIASSGHLPESAKAEGPRLAAVLGSALEAKTSDAPAVDGAEASAPEKGSDGSSRTVRVDSARIDALVDLVGELIIAKNSLRHLSAQGEKEGSPLAAALTATAAGFDRLSGDIHRAVMGMRMVPIARTFSRFPRWMRETAAKLGKDVQFEVTDNGAEADKSIVDGLFEPLLHVLRNAVDHGIDDPAARQAAGKPARGVIALEARPEADMIAVSVTDDGRGLDVTKIREAAKHKGVMSDEAIDALDDAAAMELIFMPGFSTASAVTDISGRGVGMDSVRTAVAALGGRVSVSSKLGTGTTVRMILPQAILVSTVVTVDVGDERFGLPIDTIAETCRVPRDRIKPIGEGEAFVLRNRTLPLLRLSDLLRLPEADSSGPEAVVLIAVTGGQSVGIEVDGVSERLDVLLRPMTGLLAGMQGVLGTALLGDGRVLLILDLPELIQ